MKKSKTLKIRNFGKIGAASISIFPEAMEEIDDLHCNDGFFVEKCVPPSLKYFRFMRRGKFEVVNLSMVKRSSMPVRILHSNSMPPTQHTPGPTMALF